jgi:MFS family permease
VAGRRRIFLAGLALFTAASLASGLALAAGAMIAARVGQGLGAALLTPAALSIITTSYAGAQRATALGVWGAIGGAGAAAGVLAGGILTTWLGWRSVFLVNVPVGVVAGLLSLRLVPRHKPRRRVVRELDLPGAALAVAGLVTVVYALAGAPAHGWGSPRTGPPPCCCWPWRWSCWPGSPRSSGRRGGRWCQRRSGEPARWPPACWSCSARPGSWSARSF